MSTAQRQRPAHRVAIDVSPLVGPRSGIGVAVAHLLDALAETEPPLDLCRYVLSFRAELPPDTVRLRLPAAAALRAWGHGPLPRVDRALGRPDVVHGTNYVVPPSRSPRLVSVYDCWFLQHPEGVHRDVALAGRVLRRSLRQGAVAHCSSHATADALRELEPGARIEVVHLGHVPLPPPAAGRPAPFADLDGVPFVVAIGTLERRKNLPRLVEAFGLAASVEPELALVIAGSDGNDSERVQQAIDALEPAVRRRVRCLGRITDDDKSWLVHRARALAYPSLDEGFGFPILEAMGAGTPVVASRAGSIPEVTGDAAVLVPVDDPELLAEALVALHRDDLLRRRCIDAGRRNVERFPWSATAAGLRSLYDALAMGRER